MEKLVFKDLPNTETPVTADNLNHNFDYVEEEITASSNEIMQFLNNCKTFTFNNEWRNAFKASGNDLTMEIPIFNPNFSQPTLNISSAELFNGVWKTISSVVLAGYNTNGAILRFVTDETLSAGNVYLVRLRGTVVVE